MKNLKFVLLSGGLLMASLAQAQVFRWAKVGEITNADSSQQSAATSIAQANGQVVATGYFVSSLTLAGKTVGVAPYEQGAFTLAGPATGTDSWLQAGLGKNVTGTAIGMDAAGNSYVSYTIKGDATFDMETIQSPADYYYSVTALVKYTPAGRVAWLRKLDAGRRVEIASLAVAADGTCTLGGRYAGTLALAGQPPLTSNQPAAYDDTSGLLAQFDAEGTCRWVRQVSAPLARVTSVALDATGEVSVSGWISAANIPTGNTTATATFAPGVTLTSQLADGFVAKYTAQGALRWVQKIGGEANNFAEGVAADASGAVFVCGEFGSNAVALGTATATFGPFQLTSTGFPSYPYGFGAPDGFVAKYDAQGTCQWVQAIRGGEYEAVRSVAVNKRGEVYVGGAAYAGVLFGTNTSLQGTTVGYQGYVAKYSGAGELRWLQSYGGSGRYSLAASSFRSGLGLTTDGVGRVYICGAFQSDAYFGGIYASGTTGSVEYPFIAALDDQELPLAARPATNAATALQVYPNPSAGPVRVAWPAGARPTHLDVLDALGRPVRTAALPPAATEHPLDLTGLPPGIYLLRLQTLGAGLLTQKLVLN
ncbi:hypothetical protein A0257_15340 [Hymenobacter psoromatis]|nr:hypothetical protein A0257_15340 [Hymenobacter psoromatis]